MNRYRSVSMLVVVALIASLLVAVVPASAQAATLLTLTLGQRNANQGDTVTVPVSISTAAGFSGIRAYQFSLAYDPTRVVPTGVSDGGFLATAGASCNVIQALPPSWTAGILSVPGWAILGCTGSSAAGNGTLANINFNVLSNAPNGKANLSLQNVVLADVNAAAVPAASVVLNNTYIQVGPGSDLRVSALGFQPIGTGSTFNLQFTITNQGGAASDPDVVTVASTGTTTPTQSINLGAIAAGASQSFTLPNYALATGSQNASFTITIQGNLQSRTGTYSPVSSNGQTPIDASFGAFLQITPPSQVNFGQLQLGTNTVAGVLNVKSNTSYQVDLFDNGTTVWHMTEWNGAAFGTRRLSDALHVQSGAAGGLHDVTAGTPPVLVTGGVAGQSGDAGQDFGLNFVQILHYADPLLPTGSTYHLILTFNGYVTL